MFRSGDLVTMRLAEGIQYGSDYVWCCLPLRLQAFGLCGFLQPCELKLIALSCGILFPTEVERKAQQLGGRLPEVLDKPNFAVLLLSGA